MVRGRVTNPKWIAGVMRHGYKGAFEIAASVDYLFAFAATTRAVRDHHFDAVYAAFIEDAAVRHFMARREPGGAARNRRAAGEALDRGMWKRDRIRRVDVVNCGTPMLRNRRNWRR